ncbi:WD40 repeat-like protein [Cryphonectria parasitica EP155]|uniref:WD40 repeat-like protein n=1 Tax=Cryphonectria parasitica (strain ATCC 38755 / EP155) TaxID=660469 RepID=A0A9P4Y2Y7_CRYP1|nr:WD40 repeat-like protein [Cryphonectria parasitica EP155]KAF3765524.1 WD40 repeat-like protein [Cryphonectria parasitica EP155]
MAGPSTPVTPRTQQVCLEPPGRTGRSADSGYGSLETSPIRSIPRYRLGRTALSISTKTYDGTSSEESDSETSGQNTPEKEIFSSPSIERGKFATLPSVSRRRISRTDSYPVMTRPKSTHHRHGSDNTAINGSRAGSLKALDRFVPTRDERTPRSERLQTTRALQDLSPSERLVRHNQDAPDPFCFRRRALPPSPTEARKSRRPSQSGTVLDSASVDETDRRVFSSSIWSIGAVVPSHGAIEDGRGGLFTSGTNAPMFNTQFPPSRPKDEEDAEKHEARLAILGLDRFSTMAEKQPKMLNRQSGRKTYWNGTQLVREDHPTKKSTKQAPELRTLPVAPFKVLDAPSLRDDFYCSILAFDPVCQTLAVGLGARLYSWSELTGVQTLEDNGLSDISWLTTLDFSSAQGKKCILAYGRSNGILNLMSLWDAPTLYDRQYPRFRFAPHVEEAPVACVSWKPTVSLRPSVNPYNPGHLVENEDLLVGDEHGNVFYYAVEWPRSWETYRHNWRGSVQCLAYITAHTQQICGLSWSPSGSMFATGGNDNICFLFEAQNRQAKHRWEHTAAVKAIAFCPWRDGLVATGGGSHDKCIHFYHTTSGVALATIAVHAQVTSLIWSTTRREIAATFGYAQPDHPYRIAVFSWPECRQVAAIPREREKRRNRTAMEGCVVVAASDESIKFHEVWSGGKKATVGGAGLLGGSDILEDLEGIEKEGDVIR